MKLRNLMKQVAVFFAWAFNSSLAVWVMMVVRNALLAAMAVWYVGDSNPRAWRARFWDRAYFVFAGLALLIFVFAIDGYLKDGMPRRDVFRRFARVLGIQLLILFPADVLTSMLNRSFLGRFSLAVIAIELIGGAGLVAYSIVKRPRRQSASSQLEGQANGP